MAKEQSSLNSIVSLNNEHGTQRSIVKFSSSSFFHASLQIIDFKLFNLQNIQAALCCM